MVLLAENRYGKYRVRLVKVTRNEGVHTVREWTVNLLIEGNYEDCFRTGDNSDVLPTDTMKNTVYSLARESTATSIENFAEELVSHFLTNYQQAERVSIDIEEKLWPHLEIGGQPHPTSFQQSSAELRTASVIAGRDTGVQITSGLSGLVVLKTSDSAFEGYLKDRLTTLRETSDRLFGTDVTATWTYTAANLPFESVRGRVREALLEAFASHRSLSVQHTLFAMAGAALSRVPSLGDITLTMPNKHCLLVDLSPFGQENPNEIFVPTDEPHGYIEARVVREPR
jgi:urate oxidase